MNKLAAIYARVSSDRQREDKTIASQTRSLREYAQVQGYTVPSEWVFEDEGYSGATLARPGLERLRDLVAEGQVQAVLVYGPDRLSRVAKYAFPFRCVPNSQALLPPSTRGTRLSCLKVPPSGGWKAPRTRTLESVRYVAQPFQAAGWRSFPAPQRAPACGGPWWFFQDAPRSAARRLIFNLRRSTPGGPHRCYFEAGRGAFAAQEVTMAPSNRQTESAP